MTETMTAEEYGRQMDVIGHGLNALKAILDAVEQVDDVVGKPGEPCPAASQAAVRAVRRIVGEFQERVCGDAPEPETRKAKTPNNRQINKTSYYRLPCGLFLEDYIEHEGLDFKWGSALKYEFRAGSKDGESRDKDRRKRNHYICEIAAREDIPYDEVFCSVKEHARKARLWSPTLKMQTHYAVYPTDWRPADEQDE